jgi:hypothetical protein
MTVEAIRPMAGQGMGDPRAVISLPFRRLVWAIPVAYLLHLAEETAGGFPGWASHALGGGIDGTVFALSNVCFMAIVLGLTAWASLTMARPAVLLLVVWTSGHLFWDCLFHVVMTVALRRYSPGLITGCLLYFPLSLALGAVILDQKVMTLRVFLAANAAGVALMLFILVCGRIIPTPERQLWTGPVDIRSDMPKFSGRA